MADIIIVIKAFPVGLFGLVPTIRRQKISFDRGCVELRRSSAWGGRVMYFFLQEDASSEMKTVDLAHSGWLLKPDACGSRLEK